MRILVTIPSLDKMGGVANYYQIARPLFTEDVDYFTTGSRSTEKGLSPFSRLLADQVRLFRKLRSGHYDLVHINPSFVPYALLRDGVSLLIAKLLGLKVLVFIRGWSIQFERRFRLWSWSLFRAVYGKADAIVVLGTEFREKLISNGYAKDVFVETTLVPDEMLNGCRLKGPIETYKRKGNAFTVLFLARIERTKGIYEALEGYRRLKIQVPSSHLIVAGDGPELDRVQRHVKDSGLSDVRFLGFVEHEDKYRTFRNADAYLFPSFYAEGMPNSLLEAMASSLPSVTRPIGGVRDFFEDGSMGYLVEEGTPDEIGARLEHLYIDCELRRQMGRYSREFAGKHFAASTVIKRLEGIYRHVVSEGLFCAAHSWLDRPDSS